MPAQPVRSCNRWRMGIGVTGTRQEQGACMRKVNGTDTTRSCNMKRESCRRCKQLVRADDDAGNFVFMKDTSEDVRDSYGATNKA